MTIEATPWMEGDAWDTSPYKAGQEILHIVERERERLGREPHDGLYRSLADINTPTRSVGALRASSGGAVKDSGLTPDAKIFEGDRSCLGA